MAQQNVSYNANSVPITGTQNSAFGYQTLYVNTTGTQNTANGYQSLYNNSGNYNTANGFRSLYLNTTGNQNTANGYHSLVSNTTGSNNTAIGYAADVSTDNLTNATAIGYNAKATASNAIQLGDAAVTKVFAGTSTKATLIAGGLQITGGTLGAGKVLTSDGTGIATWQTPVSTDWSITGNAGIINESAHFIGTTDDVPFNIRVNNQKAGRIEANLYTANAFYGYQAGNSNAGLKNTANGYQALFKNTTGNDNTANGYWALYFNTTGSQNTANGYKALNSNSTGSRNTGLGYLTDVLYGNLTNATAIGYSAKVTASNAIQLGDANVTQVFAGVGNAATLFAGNCVLGTVSSTPAGYKLYVAQGILTEKVKIALGSSANWADYVFTKDYKLKPLSEVETFVNENKHLPGVPSAGELVKEGGIDVNQMLAKQMEKIEELTLYMIDLNKKVAKLETENASLKTAVNSTQKQ